MKLEKYYLEVGEIQNLLRTGIAEKKIDAAHATILVAIILVHTRVVCWSSYEVGLDAK